MCGITGAYAFKEEGICYLKTIEKANQCLYHRGPDGEGIFQDNKVALAHRRLSILDVSTAANQPMYSKDQRYCIIFNGEIFNYQEIKNKYFGNHVFETTSDTEVFLEFFIKKGLMIDLHFLQIKFPFPGRVHHISKSISGLPF